MNTLETTRLILRPWATSDLDDMHRILNNQAVSHTLNKVPFPYDQQDARERLQGWINGNARGTRCGFAVTKRGLENLAGCFDVKISDGGKQGTLGYWLCESYWGQGLVTEAGEAVVSHCFENLNLERLAAQYRVGNDASGRVLAKLGFTSTGTTTQYSETLAADTQICNAELKKYDWKPS